MELTNNQKKMDLVARLVKEGAIDFNEAIDLLTVEVKFLPNTFIPIKDKTSQIEDWTKRQTIFRQRKNPNPFEIKYQHDTKNSADWARVAFNL